MRTVCVLICMRGFLKGSETVWVSDCWSRTNIWQKVLKGEDPLSHSKAVRVSAVWWTAVRSPSSNLMPVSYSRWRPSHPDGAAPLRRGAAAGEGHARVSGQQGLPLRLESGLEGGRQQQQQQQQLGGEQEPRGAAAGRPLQLEQHPEAPCRPVEEGGLCDLWGHPGLPDSPLRDPEERPVFPVLTWLTGTLLLVLLCCCSHSDLCKHLSLWLHVFQQWYLLACCNVSILFQCFQTIKICSSHQLFPSLLL